MIKAFDARKIKSQSPSIATPSIFPRTVYPSAFSSRTQIVPFGGKCQTFIWLHSFCSLQMVPCFQIYVVPILFPFVVSRILLYFIIDFFCIILLHVKYTQYMNPVFDIMHFFKFLAFLGEPSQRSQNSRRHRFQ